jgi:signal transduction histidine kinase
VSLRTRLLLAVGAVALICLLIADVVTYQTVHSLLYGQIDNSLEAAHVPIESELTGVLPRGAPPGSNHTAGPGQGSPSGGASPAIPQAAGPGFCEALGIAPLEHGIAPGTFIELRSATGAVLGHCSVTPLGSRKRPVPTLPAHITGFTTSSANHKEPTVYFNAASKSPGGYRVRASVLLVGPYAGGQLILAQPLATTASTLGDLFDVELVLTAAALLASVLLGWWLVRVGTRPLRAMQRTAQSIAAGELDQRVPGDQDKTEVGRLARALNVMLERIENAFAQRDATEAELRESEARMRRLVADASHELRTPIAAVSAYAELFERGASGRPQDLARVIEGIRGETSRMSSLVDDLMLLARLDEGRPLERQPVELVEIAAESIQTATTVAPQWPVSLLAVNPVEVVGDGARIRQVLDNLLSNVRAHTPAGTSTLVEVARMDGDAVITVSDDGPGLSDEQAAHVFERFYRADPSRSREHGGAGLGLSIVASIVRAHGGTVRAESPRGSGGVFTVRIPLAPGSNGQGEGVGAGRADLEDEEEVPSRQLSGDS